MSHLTNKRDVSDLHIVTKDQPLVLHVTNEKREQEWQVFVTVDENGEPRTRVSWIGVVE